MQVSSKSCCEACLAPSRHIPWVTQPDMICRFGLIRKYRCQISTDLAVKLTTTFYNQNIDFLSILWYNKAIGG